MLDYLPKRVLGLSLERHPESLLPAIPRMYTRAFDIAACSLVAPHVSIDFIAVGTPMRPDYKLLESAMGAIESSGSPVVAVSPSLAGWQKERLSSLGAPYIQDAQNAYLPFAGLVAAKGPASHRPSPLSPQAQRIVVNLFEGQWQNLTAGALAERTGKSRASVTKYLAEIEAICPAVVRTSGRVRSVGLPDVSRQDLLDQFEPYLRTPVKKTIHLSCDIEADKAVAPALRMSGLRALEMCSDLAFGTDGQPTVATEARNVEEALAKIGKDTDVVLPWWDESGTELELWTYWDDAPMRASGALSGGLDSVGRVSLYLSLGDRYEDDVRVADAIDQLREDICRG